MTWNEPVGKKSQRTIKTRVELEGDSDELQEPCTGYGPTAISVGAEMRQVAGE